MNALTIVLLAMSAAAQTTEPASAKALAAHTRSTDCAFEGVLKSVDDVL